MKNVFLPIGMEMASVLQRARGRLWKRPARNSAQDCSGPPASCADAVDFRALVEQSVDMICQVRQTSGGHVKYVYVSPSSTEIVGWTPEEMKDGTHTMIYPPASLATIRDAGKQLVAGAASTVVTIQAIHKDGHAIWLENRVRKLTDDGNGNCMVVVCMRDATERKLLQDQLASLVLVDALTGVGNRRAFDSALDREWQQMVQRESALSLLLIDVDYFKQINDTYGHQVGDDCIRLVAQKISQLLNRPEAFVARYGGDEMAVLLPGIDESAASELGTALCRGVESSALLPIDTTVGARPLTISCGGSTATAKLYNSRSAMARVPAELIAAADRALYTAKRQGRNQAAVAAFA